MRASRLLISTSFEDLNSTESLMEQSRPLPAILKSSLRTDRRARRSMAILYYPLAYDTEKLVSKTGVPIPVPGR
jgi:hypothetical protein